MCLCRLGYRNNIPIGTSVAIHYNNIVAIGRKVRECNLGKVSCSSMSIGRTIILAELVVIRICRRAIAIGSTVCCRKRKCTSTFAITPHICNSTIRQNWRIVNQNFYIILNQSTLPTVRTDILNIHRICSSLTRCYRIVSTC